MKTLINIDNYEEIMFRLLEDDFDLPTRIDLLRQIESDELFKFEWESWQKTRFVDPLENYSSESIEMTEKIILIAGPRVSGRKKLFFYWAAAAAVVLFAGMFLLTADFRSLPKPGVAVTGLKSPVPAGSIIPQAQKTTLTLAVADRKQSQERKSDNLTIPVTGDSSNIAPVTPYVAIIPAIINSVPVKSMELAIVPQKKPRYTITIETSDIADDKHQNIDLTQNEKMKFRYIFTNTKMLLSRKPNGEPDKIYIIGDENSYLCININY